MDTLPTDPTPTWQITMNDYLLMIYINMNRTLFDKDTDYWPIFNILTWAPTLMLPEKLPHYVSNLGPRPCHQTSCHLLSFWLENLLTIKLILWKQKTSYTNSMYYLQITELILSSFELEIRQTHPLIFNWT